MASKMIWWRQACQELQDRLELELVLDLALELVVLALVKDMHLVYMTHHSLQKWWYLAKYNLLMAKIYY
jgi:hypothetical protein